MKVQFKLKATAGPKDRDQLLAALREQGASAVRALFPGDRDRELARLYVADVAGDAAGRRVLAWLRKARAVEFVEPEVVRKLIR